LETSVLQTIPKALFALLFPDDCRICGDRLKDISRIPVCPRCLREPEPLETDYCCASCRAPFLNEYPLDEDGRCGLCRLGMTGFDAAYSFGFYEGTLRELVHLFKFGRIETLARPLAEMTLRALPREQRFDAVVPMPMHWRRRWQRGFNQSALLAKNVARRLGLPVLGLVRRKRATPPQAGLSSAQRRTNVARAFEVRNPERVAGKRLLLVDDVYTTGATAGACAASLKRAGAERVVVLTLARTDRRPLAEPLTGKKQERAIAVGAT
jgi:ComF family protein